MESCPWDPAGSRWHAPDQVLLLVLYSICSTFVVLETFAPDERAVPMSPSVSKPRTCVVVRKAYCDWTIPAEDSRNPTSLCSYLWR